jgi:hypothetical protein
MLEPYRQLLERLRRDRGSWAEVAYVAVPDPQWVRIDAGYRHRYGVLVCLQYDRRAEDHGLIRHLFRQEVLARGDAPFQGETPALHLGAFLLARFRRPEDVPLFWEAKTANFDTLCAFDARYLLVVDRQAGLALLRGRYSGLRMLLTEMLGKTPEKVSRQELDRWWAEKERIHPERETDEDPLVLAQRAVELGAPEEGRRALDVWEASQPADAQTLYTLMHLREALEQPAHALAAVEKLCDLWGDDPWNHASALLNKPRLLVRLGRHEEAWRVLVEVRRILDRDREMMGCGMARSAAEEMLDLAADGGCPADVRRRVWEGAHDLMRRARNGLMGALVMLEKAETVAGLAGDLRLKKQYERRAAWERLRIRLLP